LRSELFEEGEAITTPLFEKHGSKTSCPACMHDLKVYFKALWIDDKPISTFINEFDTISMKELNNLRLHDGC
jgi:hypothetical protein